MPAPECSPEGSEVVLLDGGTRLERDRDLQEMQVSLHMFSQTADSLLKLTNQVIEVLRHHAPRCSTCLAETRVKGHCEGAHLECRECIEQYEHDWGYCMYPCATAEILGAES